MYLTFFDNFFSDFLPLREDLMSIESTDLFCV